MAQKKLYGGGRRKKRSRKPKNEVFWGTVKDVQAIATWNNTLISTLIHGIPLDIFLSEAAWNTNSQHRRGGERRKERQGGREEASRNGQGVREATEDVAEGPGVHTSHALTALRRRCPVPSSFVSLTLALSTQERHQKVHIKPEIEASDLLVSLWSFQLLRHDKQQALGENEVKRKIIMLRKKVFFPPTDKSNLGILTSER